MPQVIKLLGLRIYNKTRSYILLRPTSEGLWEVPTISLRYNEDITNRMERIIREIGSPITIISLVNIAEFTHEISDDLSFHNVVYDVRYRGKIHPGQCKKETNGVGNVGKWALLEDLVKHESLAAPTQKLVELMDSTPCLRY